MKIIISITLLVLGSTFLIAQTPWVLPGNTVSSGDFIGTTNTQPLELKTTNTGSPQPINFYTGNVLQATIDGSGNLGIGTNSPTQLLTVTGGNINLGTGNNSYMINGIPVLWNNNINSSIYVGRGTGSTGTANTFVGPFAGSANTIGGSNTYLGNGAAFLTQSGSENVAVGVLSLASMINANNNVAVGVFAGNNTTGSDNTFVGTDCGSSTTIGEFNAFMGSSAGFFNTTGIENVFMGHLAGRDNTTGSHNLCIGEFANVGSGALNYASAIGPYAVVTQSNSLILGCTTPVSINVGIGVTAPARRLEIMDGTNPQLRLTNSQASSVQTDFNTTSAGNLLIAPSSSGTAKNVGINFTTATSPVPAQTLDVNGTAAIRSVANDNSLTQVLVRDNANNGVIKYRDASTFSGSGNVSSCLTSTQNLLTKWCSATNNIQNSIVYDNGSRVGIGNGTTTPNAKLQISNSVASYGLYVQTTLASGLANYGMYGTSTSSGSLFNVGVAGTQTSNGNTFNIGVFGSALGSSTYNFGGMFDATNGCVAGRVNYGIYASASPNYEPSFGCAKPVAGYFNGNVNSTALVTIPSDEQFKDSIINIKNALGVIANLDPKQFVFKNDSFPSMNLPEGKQFGVMAQQLDTVLPDLTVFVVHPAQYDTSGTMLYDSIHYKAVNYMGLIPLALAGIKEQQLLIDTLKSKKVSSIYTATDSNYVVKWSGTNNTLRNGQMYDDGQRVGIPAADAGVYVNVVNHQLPVAASFESDSNTATGVLKARYSANGNSSTIAAVDGYSNYVNSGSQDDGMGGHFEGGMAGAYGLGTGANSLGFGLFGESMNATFINAGVRGIALTATPSVNTGVFGTGDSADYINVGTWGTAQYVNSTSNNVGAWGVASGSSFQNFAARFDSQDTTGLNYGVFAGTAASGTNFYAGYFDGDVHATGTVTWTSDARLKNNIENIKADNALNKVLALQPKTYTFNRQAYPYLNLPQGNQYGLLAQDVEQIVPELVQNIVQPELKDERGNPKSPRLDYKGLNYTGLIPLLVGAVKQQQQQIDSLKNVIDTRLGALEERLAGCCGTGKREAVDDNDAETVSRLNVELNNLQVVVLEQNVPNPFAEQTSISYFIPQDVQGAQMLFADMLGRVIKTVDVEKGYGVVTVFAGSLGTGQYSYSLVIDGKVIETKKMVKSK